MIKSTRLRSTLSASTILAAGLLLVVAPAHAQNLPDTGNVSASTRGLSGGAPGSTDPTFTTTGTAGAQTLRVDLKDNRTILTWRGTGFNIAAGNTVDFKDARATNGISGRTDNIAVLNRVMGPLGTQATVNGTLRSDANVAVYVISQSGVYFSPTASVDTGALFASTSDLTDDNDFLNGSAVLRFGQYATDEAAVVTNPGARFKTTASTSSNGGHMGDLVFLGAEVFHNDGVTSNVGGDAAFIAATDVTVVSAPGSPLSFMINRGTDIANTFETIRVGGTVNASNILVAAVNAKNIGSDAIINVRGELNATGALVTDRGVVLTAGNNSTAGVTIAPGNFRDGSIDLSGSISSTKNIYLNNSRGLMYSSISGTLSAAGLLDATGGYFFGPALNGSVQSGTITAGSIAIHGGGSFAVNPVKTTAGDFTFDGGGSIFINGSNFDIKGSLIGTADVFGQISGNMNVGGAISVTTSGDQDWWAPTTAAGSIYLGSTAFGSSIETSNGTIRSIGGDITMRSQGHITLVSAVAAGKVDIESLGEVTVDSATGGQGVRLVADPVSGGGFDNGRLKFGTITATGATADVTLSGAMIQKINDLEDGGTIPIDISAGRDVSITQTGIQRTLLLGTVVAGRNVQVTGASVNATKIQGTTGSVTVNGVLSSIIPNDGAVFIDNLVADLSGNVNGRVITVNNASAAAGDLTFAATGGSVALGLTNAASNINAAGDISITATSGAVLRGNVTAGGNLSATGSTVGLGTAAFLNNQIKAAGAIDLTATTSAVNGTGNVSVESNSDGIGTEALTISAATAVNFSAGTSLIGGTARQSDIIIKTPGSTPLAFGNIAARTLKGSSGGGPIYDALIRNAPIALRGNVSLTNSLTVEGTLLTLSGPITVANGYIDLRASSPLTVGGAIKASGDVTVLTSAGDLTVAAGGSFTGHTVVLSTPGAFLNNGGANIMSASDRWVVYSAAPNGDTFGGLDSGNTAVWNSTFASSPPLVMGSLPGNRYVFAYQPTLTFASLDFSKVYGTALNGNNSPYSVTGYQPGVAGAFLGDTAGTAFAGFPLFASDGFAERATVTGGPYQVLISPGSLSSHVGYAFTFSSAGHLTVAPKPLDVNLTAFSKTYDGTTTASGDLSISGIVAGDTVDASGTTFAFADKNAGVGKTVNVTGATLTGADAGNYTLTLPAAVMADIFQRAITANVTANNKTYDGTTAGTGSVTLNGIVSGDAVGTTGTTFTFGDKNAGVGKTVAVAGTALTGADAGNYTFTIPASALADILKKAITANVTADSKIYDGTTAGTGSVTLNGVVSGDTVGTSGTTFAFADKNAGTGKTVNVGGTTLTGADAGNYTVTVPASALADILKKALTAGVTASNKTYDGSTTGTGTVTLNGVVAGDTVGTSGTTFTFADKNAGTGKSVAVAGTALTGADAGNYTVTIPASALADILKKAITASVVVNNKTYDGTTAGTGSVTLNGVVSGDAVSTSGTTFTFGDKNAATGKTVALAGTTIGGADAGNYSIAIPASALADILKRALTVTADDASKVQNDPDPTLTFTLSSGSLVTGDSFSGGVARDTGENPGTYAIKIGTLSAGNNYTITFTPGTFTINLPLGSEGLQPAFRAQPLPSQLQTDPPAGSSVDLQTSAVCGDDKNCTTGNPTK